MKRSIMQLSNEAKFKLAVHSALLAGLATGASGTASAQETTTPASDTPTELEEIVVTGSRIKRAGMEGALPVTVIDRASIDMSGEISVSDFLRNMSLNTFGSFRQQSGSSAQGLAALDLRGLGSERTLILIDGKRAPKAPYAPTAQDLNSIPLAAVERIEILQDGASAIYGSDAIAGVVNIIMRKDFQGTQFMYGAGYPNVEGGDTEQMGLLMGLPTATGNIVIGASYNTKDIIFARDQIPLGLNAPGASGFGNNYVTPVDNFASFNGVPGGCSASDAFFIAPGSASTVDLDGNGTFDVCRYDFNKVAADEASTNNMALFVKGKFNINKDWAMYTTGSVSRAESFGRYAPAPAIFFVPGSASGIDHDGDGTDDDVYVYHRFDALGNRDNFIEGTVYDLLAGFQGDLVGADVDFGARYNEFKNYDIGRNYVVLPIVEQFTLDGSYNFRDPLANSASVLNSMKATLARESTWKTRELWASVSNDIFTLPGGRAALASGFDYYRAEYADQYDSLSEGGVIGGSAGNSAGQDRRVTGYYAELLLPLVENLEVTAALRFDEYSDLAGKAEASPKISARYQPMEILTTRAAYGQGFRAPTLDVISLQPSFSATPVINDGPTCVFAGGTFTNGVCNQIVQINATIIANPQLAPEDSDQYSLGVVVDPVEYLGFSLDYYKYKISDIIDYLSTPELVELQNRGEALPPGLSITRNATQGPPPGRIVSSIEGFANRGELETSGLNLDVDFNWNFGELGRVNSRVLLGYILTWEFDSIGRDQVNDPGFPQVRWNWNTSYNYQQFAVAWNQNYIGDQARSVSGSGQQAQQVGSVGAYWTHDLQLSYDAPMNFGTFTLGVLNATDEDIPVYPFDVRNYNFFLYDSYGRVPYFRYTLRFG